MPYSPVIPINLTLPWTQTIAAASQLQYSTNWTADALSDVVVYHRAASTTANDLTQIVNPINYVASFVGSNYYIQVDFIAGYVVALNDVITITRNTPIDRMNLYINTNFNPSMLNEDFNRIILMMQERLLCDNYLSIKYNNSETLNTNDITDNIIPVLPAQYIWEKDSGNDAIIAVPIPSGGGGGGSVTSVGIASSTLTLSGTNPVTSSGLIGVNLPVVGAITPGAYTSANLTVDAYGRITLIANGTGGGGNSGAMVETINQAAHGFTLNQIVYWTGTQYALAKADTASDAEVFGMVTTVTNANSFVLTVGGLVTTSGLSTGVNFLSDAVAGSLTTVAPTTPGHIEKPLLIATSATSGLFINWRGKIIPNPAPVVGSWTAVAVDTIMISGANYMATANITLTLPSVAAQFDEMEIYAKGCTVTIAQGAGQIVTYNTAQTTLGAAGSVETVDDNSYMRLLCTANNTDFDIIDSQGAEFTIT